MRDSLRLVALLCLTCAVTLVGCEQTDPSAERLLRAAVANEYAFQTKGEVKVSVAVAGSVITPWYRVRQGTDAQGPFRKLEHNTSKSIFPAGTQPSGTIERTVRTGVVAGQSAAAIDSIVAIDDIETFLRAHHVQQAAAPNVRVIAGRRVTALTATAKDPDGYYYRIYIDEQQQFILGMEEFDKNRQLLHGRRYDTIQYLDASAPTPTGGGIRRMKRIPLGAAAAEKIIGLPASRLFPKQMPAGFSHLELVKTDALDSIHVRLTNGTTTGAILVYVRKPSITKNTRPSPPPAEVRDLVLSGKAMVEGQTIGLTYAVDHFACIEIHTPDKSVLIMTSAGLDTAKSVAGRLPLP